MQGVRGTLVHGGTTAALPRAVLARSFTTTHHCGAPSTSRAQQSATTARMTWPSSPRAAFPTASAFSQPPSRLHHAPMWRSSLRTYASAAETETATAAAPAPEVTWQIRMLYDGDCPLCMKEVNFLKDRNEKYQAIDFVDIAAEDYSPEANAGIEWETAMDKIHAIEADGRVITGIEVFRRLYEVVGLGWVYGITKNPVVGRLADRVYDFWAKYRLPITGRPAFAVVLEARRQKLGDAPTCGLDGKCD